MACVGDLYIDLYQINTRLLGRSHKYELMSGFQERNYTYIFYYSIESFDFNNINDQN